MKIRTRKQKSRGKQKGGNNQNLINAIIHDDFEEVETLIEGGINLNQENEDGITPLLTAAMNDNLELVKLLIDNGAKVNYVGSTGYSVLNSLASNSNVTEETLSIIQMLINNGANINEKEPIEGFTPLLHAIENNNIDIIKLLIDNDVDVNITDNFGTTPLLLAANKKNGVIVDMLLETDRVILDESTKDLAMHNAFTEYISKQIRDKFGLPELDVPTGSPNLNTYNNNNSEDPEINENDPTPLEGGKRRKKSKTMKKKRLTKKKKTLKRR